MDPQVPTLQEQPQVGSTPTQIDNQTEPIKGEHKGNGIVIGAMALFVLISFAALAFLYYQNQQLKQMLTKSPLPVNSASSNPNNEEYVNWSEYTDHNHLLSFRYPPHMQLSNNTDKTVLKETLYVPELDADNPYAGAKFDNNLIIQTYPTSQTGNLESFYKKVLESLDLPQNFKIDNEKIIIDNTNGYKIIPPGAEISKNEILIFIKNQTAYKIDIESTGNNGFEKVISSFKFFDEMNLKTDLTTYTNEKYGYQIKYPSGLVVNKATNENTLDSVSFDGAQTYNPYSVDVYSQKLEDVVSLVRSQIEGHFDVKLTTNVKSIFNNSMAYILTYTPNKPNEESTTHFLVTNKKYTYVLKLRTSYYKEVLSTFKFISKTNATSSPTPSLLPFQY